jgi:hypothetical protein
MSPVSSRSSIEEFCGAYSNADQRGKAQLALLLSSGLTISSREIYLTENWQSFRHVNELQHRVLAQARTFFCESDVIAFPGDSLLDFVWEVFETLSPDEVVIGAATRVALRQRARLADPDVPR